MLSTLSNALIRLMLFITVIYLLQVEQVLCESSGSQSVISDSQPIISASGSVSASDSQSITSDQSLVPELNKYFTDATVVDYFAYGSTLIIILVVLVLIYLMIVSGAFSKLDNFKLFIIITFLCISVPAVYYLSFLIFKVNHDYVWPYINPYYPIFRIIILGSLVLQLIIAINQFNDQPKPKSSDVLTNGLQVIGGNDDHILMRGPLVRHNRVWLKAVKVIILSSICIYFYTSPHSILETFSANYTMWSILFFFIAILWLFFDDYLFDYNNSLTVVKRKHDKPQTNFEIVQDRISLFESNKEFKIFNILGLLGMSMIFTIKSLEINLQNNFILLLIWLGTILSGIWLIYQVTRLILLVFHNHLVDTLPQSKSESKCKSKSKFTLNQKGLNNGKSVNSHIRGGRKDFSTSSIRDSNIVKRAYTGIKNTIKHGANPPATENSLIKSIAVTGNRNVRKVATRFLWEQVDNSEILAANKLSLLNNPSKYMTATEAMNRQPMNDLERLGADKPVDREFYNRLCKELDGSPEKVINFFNGNCDYSQYKNAITQGRVEILIMGRNFHQTCCLATEGMYRECQRAFTDWVRLNAGVFNNNPFYTYLAGLTTISLASIAFFQAVQAVHDHAQSAPVWERYEQHCNDMSGPSRLPEEYIYSPMSYNVYYWTTLTPYQVIDELIDRLTKVSILQFESVRDNAIGVNSQNITPLQDALNEFLGDLNEVRLGCKENLSGLTTTSEDYDKAAKILGSTVFDVQKSAGTIDKSRALQELTVGTLKYLEDLSRINSPNESSEQAARRTDFLKYSLKRLNQSYQIAESIQGISKTPSSAGTISTMRLPDSEQSYQDWLKLCSGKSKASSVMSSLTGERSSISYKDLDKLDVPNNPARGDSNIPLIQNTSYDLEHRSKLYFFAVLPILVVAVSFKIILS